MFSKEKFKCKKVKPVLRYHVPNPHKRPEKYAHHNSCFTLSAKNQTCVQLKVEHIWKNLVICGKNIVNENKQSVNLSPS